FQWPLNGHTSLQHGHTVCTVYVYTAFQWPLNGHTSLQHHLSHPKGAQGVVKRFRPTPLRFPHIHGDKYVLAPGSTASNSLRLQRFRIRPTPLAWNLSAGGGPSLDAAK